MICIPQILKTALKKDDGDGGPEEKGEVNIDSSTPAAISEPLPPTVPTSAPQPTLVSSVPPKETPSNPVPADVPDNKSSPIKESVPLAEHSEGPGVVTDAGKVLSWYPGLI